MRADESDFGTDGQKHGLDAFESGFVTRHHERSLALANRERGAGNGSIEHGEAGFSEFGGDGPAAVGIDGAHVEIDGVFAQAGDDAVFAESQSPNGSGIGNYGEDDFRCTRNFAR